ncbi:alpha/beta fold hydrolase [Fodinicurvata sp. EGI_FJ10296]|uniref:YheT family hydrolase n=1 Tax=Fodinicurvata sp. EGI_FJ10296 TaxID=3231908 RepID=UPI003452BFC5
MTGSSAAAESEVESGAISRSQTLDPLQPRDRLLDRDRRLAHGLVAPPLAFNPRMPWFGGDLQTVRNTLLKPFGGGRRKLPGYRHQHIVFPLRDGSGDRLVACLSLPADGAPPAIEMKEFEDTYGWPDTVAVPDLSYDLGRAVDASRIDWTKLRPAMSSRPLVILCHGLSGCETSHYMVASTRYLLQSGFAVLRMNLRGAGPSRAYASTLYHAGRTDDLRDVIDSIDPPAGGLALCGFSLGGSMVLKLMGELGDDHRIAAAFSISAPIDLAGTQRRLMAPRNRLYHHWFLRRMLNDMTSIEGFMDAGRRRRTALVRTVRDFDSHVIAPEAGYETAEAYYEDASAVKYLPMIRRPTVLIHAENDPWIPVAPYLAFPWASNKMLLPLILPSGGHVGFHDRSGPPSWHDRKIVGFLSDISSL